MVLSLYTKLFSKLFLFTANVQMKTINLPYSLMLSDSLRTFVRTFFNAVIRSGPFGQFILFLLLILSIISWAIMWNRYWTLRWIKQLSERFLSEVWMNDNENKEEIKNTDFLVYVHAYKGIPIVKMFNLVIGQLQKYSNITDPLQDVTKLSKEIERALDGIISETIPQLERYMTFLATVVTIAPFLGLLGTVWGILATFHTLAIEKTANITALYPSLAEALITTVAGLAVAIPAVMGYNYFVGQIRNLINQMEWFALELLNYIEERLRIHFSQL